MSTSTGLAHQFFSAAENGDMETLRTICHADMKAIQNGAPPMGLEPLIQFTQAVGKLVPDFHYENPVRSQTDTGFVEEHDVMGTLPDGKALKLNVCVVATVEAGQITEMREYFDTYAARGLAKALSQ